MPISLGIMRPPQGAERRAGAPHGGLWELRPYEEAGAPSTGGWVVPAPPGVVMVAPLEVPRNAGGAMRRPRPGGYPKKRRQGQYRGWGPTPSIAAAREPYPSRGLLQRCYKSAYRG